VAAALRLLPVDGARVAQPERLAGSGEGGGGHARQAGGEVVPERQDAAVAVGEADEPLGDAGSPRPEERLLVLEGGRDQLLVARPLEHLHRRVLEQPAATGGLAGEVECTGRRDGNLGGKHGAGR